MATIDPTAPPPPPPPAPPARLAREADVPGIVRVYVRAYAQPPWLEQNDPGASERYLRDEMAAPTNHCLVVEQDGAVAGFVLAGHRAYEDFVADWERMGDRPAEGWPVVPGRLGYIWEIAVDPDQQRRGVGTALLRGAIDRLAREGCERVLLRSSERAAAAIALYRKFGFRRLPVRERRDTLAGPWLLDLAHLAPVAQ